MTGEPVSRARDADPFGAVLPDDTTDEDGRGWGDEVDTGEEWLRTEVPPHHL